MTAIGGWKLGQNKIVKLPPKNREVATLKEDNVIMLKEMCLGYYFWDWP